MFVFIFSPFFTFFFESYAEMLYNIILLFCQSVLMDFLVTTALRHAFFHNTDRFAMKHVTVPMHLAIMSMDVKPS